MNNKAESSDVAIFVFAAVFIIGLVVCAVGFDYVPAGTVGVTDKLGDIGTTPLQPGVYWTGFLTSTHEMNARIQVKEYSAAAASKDLQTVDTKVAVNFRIEPTQAPTIYRTIGQDYQSVIITPIVNEAVRDGTSKYTAEELITKRADAKKYITDSITQKLGSRGLLVSEVAITEFDFSDEFDAAIERKQVAEQDALTAANKLEETKLLVQGSKLQQEILAARSLDLQSEWIKKWDGRLPTYMGSESDVMMFQPTAAVRK